MPSPAHSPLRKQVQAVGATLRRLEGQLRGLVPALARESKATAARAVAKAKQAAKAMQPTGKRKLNLSPERRRALKLQGSYLGYMRRLSPTQKARVRAVKAKKKIHAAIATARRMAKG
jgi:hypothetical protein